MSCTTVPILVLEAQWLRSQQVLTCRICQNPCYTLYIPCIVIHPCKITYTSKDEKTSLNMAPAVKGFILTWKKVYPMDFIFASMLQIIGHTLEGSMSNGPNHQNLQNTASFLWLTWTIANLGFNIDFLLIFHVKGPKPQYCVNTA